MAAVMDPVVVVVVAVVAASARVVRVAPCETAGCRRGSAASSVVVHFGRVGQSSAYAHRSNVDEHTATGWRELDEEEIWRSRVPMSASGKRSTVLAQAKSHPQRA
jgi:hypothetical protein